MKAFTSVCTPGFARRLALAASLAAITLLPVQAAEAPSEEPRLVSADLMSALEGWSGPSTSLEALALEERSDMLQAYANELARLYRRPLLEHLELNYPEAHADVLATLPVPALVDVEVLAYVMAAREVEYHSWQAESALVAAGLRFADFVGRSFPDAVEAVNSQAPSPASRGVALLDFVRDLGDAELEAEAQRLVASVLPWPPKKPCGCWTVATFPHQPEPWQTEANEAYYHDWGWPTKKVRQLNYYAAGRGVAKDINFYRRTRNTLWEADRVKGFNNAQMRVRMHCTQSGVPGGVECAGQPCRGDLSVRIAYGSRVSQQVAFGGAFSKEARSIASDMARLTYDPPGAPPLTTLFSKGVAVSGFTASNWNSGALIQVLTTAAQVGLTAAGDGTAAGALLEGNLINDTITALFGLIKREGSASSHMQDMHVAWDTANTSPIQFFPNQTHLFNLDSLAKTYGRGYGVESQSWAHVDSSAYFTAVARNYQCASHATAPTPRAYWFWATSGAPHSTTTIQNLVRNYVTTELGVMPTNVSQQIGQYP